MYSPRRSRPGRRVLVVCISAALAAASMAAQGPPIVERVVDGELIVVSGLGIVRLLGVDVPQTVDARQPAAPQADPAAAFLRDLLTNAPVRIEYDATREDSAKRPLAYVYVGDGLLVNAELVRRGLGRVNAALPFRRLDQFRGFEREAQEAGRGLWAGRPAPPGGPSRPPRAPGTLTID
jgi:micrococcal nuclease